MLRKIVCEIDVPEDYDACWQDGSGIQCFSDVAIIPLHIHNTKEICEIINLEKTLNADDKRLANYKRVKLNVRKTVKIVGYIDSNNNFRKDF